MFHKIKSVVAHDDMILEIEFISEIRKNIMLNLY